MTEKTRTQNQDDWKRTQIRIPLPFYEEIVEFAEQRNISINTAMLELMERGIHSAEERENKAVIGVQREHLMLLNEYQDLQKKTLNYQDDLLASKKEIIRLYSLLNEHKIHY
ncbi:hypothetical protein F886_00038 [Acinetobacter sp. NIPH 542]|uniref:hypothetical protein n=1 Tax=Acinetobacter sp. NIPH 542 TaxID=1217688 RepID=UPI0002D00F16|nr:hypothetical protein [Acinetobacter sp. NIPH 542]ENX48237.1 hypothetical protein F886_00038 [Acinetobacter sp. NIPH 542]